MWKAYVKYMVRKYPHKPLKSLLKNYDRAEYERFKKNPKQFV